MNDSLSKKVRLGTLGLLLSVLLIAGSPPPVWADQDPEFSAERAYEHVKVLAQKIGPRPAGSKAELRAAQYIYSTLEQYGWKVHDQPFSKVVVQNVPILETESRVRLINSQNIIAELPGTRQDTILLGAHYDSAGVNVPGAVDNASGVGTLLELARVLSQNQHEYTYQFVFFGAEEAGLVGSNYYVANADLSAVNWMLNLDMAGTPIEIDVAGSKSAPSELIDQVVREAGLRNLPYHISRDFIMMTRDSAQGGASDFSPFLEQGIPAVGLGVAGRPEGFYHRPEDSLEHVSLEEIQKVGEYVQSLVQTVRLEQSGPRVWDELYLTFEVGGNVIIVPTIGLKIFYLLTFGLTILVFIRFYKQNPLPSWKAYLWTALIVVPISLGIVLFSGSGEFLWSRLKDLETVWYAYPQVFLLVRLGAALGLVLFLGSWFPRLPLPRAPGVYWVSSAGILLVISLLTLMARVDLAFPFVFWLFCLNLQWFKPNVLLVLLGPYFLYTFHWELLNSQQWVDFYSTMGKYWIVFGVVYALLLIPLLLAALHVAALQKTGWPALLPKLRRPVLVLLVAGILGLGLVPNYTPDYPQPVTVREEWQENDGGRVHIFSADRFPSELQRSLQISPGKSTYFPTLNEKAPFKARLTLVEKRSDQRMLDVALRFQYSREPYLVKLRLESAKPFEVVQLDFLPVAKLPKAQQLAGTKQNDSYVLVMERTPPHKEQIQMTIRTDGTIKCTVEAEFADPEPRVKIAHENVSVDYQSWVQTSFEF